MGSMYILYNRELITLYHSPR